MTTTRSMHSALPPSTLEEVRRVIAAAGVIAMPTETYYALAASPYSAPALERVARIKGRPEGNPLLVLVADRSAIGTLATEVPQAGEILMRRFWPGPLTVVLPARPTLPRLLTAATGTVGIRQPDHPLLLSLLAAVGPLTGTSANRSGQPPAETAEAVQETLGGDVDLILDGGRTPGRLPSTVVSAVEPLRVLREGRIPRAVVAAALAEFGVRLSEETDRAANPEREDKG